MVNIDPSTQAITSDSYEDAPLGALFREAKFQLGLSFKDYRMIYVHRSSCNKPAHELAALGVVEPPGYHKVWFDHYPNSITRVMSGTIPTKVNKMSMFQKKKVPK
jgi:hypothetical protein